MSKTLETSRKENKNFLKDYERNRAFILDLIKQNDFLKNQTPLSGTDETKTNYGIQQNTIDNVASTDADREIEKINSLLTVKIADVDAYYSFFTKSNARAEDIEKQNLKEISRKGKEASKDVFKSNKTVSIVNYNDVLILYNNVIRLYKKPGTSQPTKSTIGNKLNSITRNIDILLIEYNQLIDYILSSGSGHRIVFKLLEAKGFYEIIKNQIFRNDYNIITQENIEVQYRKEILSLSQSRRNVLEILQEMEDITKAKYKTIDELKFDTDIYIKRIENSTGTKIPIELKRKFKDMGIEEINRALDSFNLLQKEEPLQIKNLEEQRKLLLSNLQKNAFAKRDMEETVKRIDGHLEDMRRRENALIRLLPKLKNDRDEYESEVEDLEREADRIRQTRSDYNVSSQYTSYIRGIKSRETKLAEIEQEIQDINNELRQIYLEAERFGSFKQQNRNRARDLGNQISRDSQSLNIVDESISTLKREVDIKINRLEGSLKTQPPVSEEIAIYNERPEDIKEEKEEEEEDIDEEFVPLEGDGKKKKGSKKLNKK
jgi:hypothetical protein